MAIVSGHTNAVAVVQVVDGVGAHALVMDDGLEVEVARRSVHASGARGAVPTTHAANVFHLGASTHATAIEEGFALAIAVVHVGWATLRFPTEGFHGPEIGVLVFAQTLVVGRGSLVVVASGFVLAPSALFAISSIANRRAVAVAAEARVGVLVNAHV